ncbi:MAG: hypothetical protein FGM27_08805 [Candidatus Omnitrophica bacterium]|nr:hypothetical protein [Candidatus Omnitrophota bacterium]
MKNQSRQTGLTLIELVVVLSLVTVLGIFVFPRLDNLTDIRAGYAAQKIRSDIRYAQMFALDTGQRTAVIFDSPNHKYELQREVSPGAWAVMMNPLTKGGYSVFLNQGDFDGVKISDVALAGTSGLIFDRRGEVWNLNDADIGEFAFIRLNPPYGLKIRRGTGKVELVSS